MPRGGFTDATGLFFQVDRRSLRGGIPGLRFTTPEIRSTAGACHRIGAAGCTISGVVNARARVPSPSAGFGRADLALEAADRPPQGALGIPAPLARCPDGLE